MIEVNSCSIVIRGVENDETYKKFYNNFSVREQVNRTFFKMRNDVFTKIGKDIYVPKTVTLEVVQKYYPDKKVAYNTIDTSKYEKVVFKMLNEPRDDLQKSACYFLSKITRDRELKQRFLSLKTSEGKTFIAINTIQRIQAKTMIVVDKIDIARQWKDELVKHTDIPVDKIIILSGQKSIDDAIANPENGLMYIAIHATLTNMRKVDVNALQDMILKLGIGVRIFDEAHQNIKSICAINATSNVEHTLYLTATPSRTKFHDNILYAKVFKIVPFFDGKFVITREKYIDVLMFSYSSEPSFDVQANIKGNQGFASARWVDHIMNAGNGNFITSLFDIFEKLNLKEKKSRIAIVLPEIQLIEYVKEQLEEYLNAPNSVGMFVGKAKVADKERALKETRIFLTNDKMFEKAINVPDLSILICYSQMRSNVKLEQMMGRLRQVENKPRIYIDVTDEGFKECRSMRSSRTKFFEERAKSITKINNRRK